MIQSRKSSLGVLRDQRSLSDSFKLISKLDKPLWSMMLGSSRRFWLDQKWLEEIFSTMHWVILEGFVLGSVFSFSAEIDHHCKAHHCLTPIRQCNHRLADAVLVVVIDTVFLRRLPFHIDLNLFRREAFSDDHGKPFAIYVSLLLPWHALVCYLWSMN